MLINSTVVNWTLLFSAVKGSSWELRLLLSMSFQIGPIVDRIVWGKYALARKVIYTADTKHTYIS